MISYGVTTVHTQTYSQTQIERTNYLDLVVSTRLASVSPGNGAIRGSQPCIRGSQTQIMKRTNKRLGFSRVVVRLVSVSLGDGIAIGSQPYTHGRIHKHSLKKEITNDLFKDSGHYW